MFNPVLVMLVVAVTVNLAGLAPRVPLLVTDIVHGLAGCAIPLGLLMTGINLANYLGEPGKIFQLKIVVSAAVLRLGVLPLVMLAAARWLPCSVELKRVLVVQAAMPTAVQIVLGTTALSVVTCPLWISAGLAWVF